MDSATGWPDFPASKLADLETRTASMDAGEQRAYCETWIQLASCIRKTDSLRAGKASTASPMPWAEEVLWRLLTQDRKLREAVSDASVRSLIQRAHHLLEIYTGRTIDPVVVRLFPPPRQTVDPSVVENLRAAVEIEGRFFQLLHDIGAGTCEPIKSQEELAGCLLLALVLDCGVLGRAELNEALRILWSERPVRGVGAAFYLLINLHGSVTNIGQERRRLFITPVTAALSLAISPASGAVAPKISVALKAICKKLGFPRASAPRMRDLMRGAAARLRFADNIPQFVVDYAEGRLSSHSISEAAYRRIVNLAPWSDELLDDEPPSQAERALSPEPDGITSTAGSSKVGYCSAIARILDQPEEPTLLGQKIEKMQTEVSPSTPVEGLLSNWIISLLREPSSKGGARQPGTIRNMLNAIGPRLVAALGVTSPEQLSPDDWKTIHEEIMEEKHSGSWIGTIYSSFNHFLGWLVRTGHLSELPIEISATGQPSTVNATLLTPIEFEQLSANLTDDLSLESVADRQYQLFIGQMGQKAATRRGEARGLMRNELHLQRDPHVDLMHNAVRRLKTESSRRRVPLTLMGSQPLLDLAAELVSANPEVPRLIFADLLSADEETLLRKLSKKLAAITGDPDVSIHTLRHSAATWLLLVIYADDLQLSRFIKQWPFLESIIASAKQVRDTLLGAYGSVHGLHVIRQLLGHRHEEMSLQHYIHALDWLRFAAVTLVTGERDRSAVRGAAGIQFQYSGPSRQSVAVVIRSLEARFPDRIRREDVARSHHPSNVNMAPADARDLLRGWLDQSAALAKPECPDTVAVRRHTELVVLINKQRAVNKSKKSAGGLTALDEIRPAFPADKQLALGIARWITTASLPPADLSQFAESMIRAHVQRGSGRFGCKTLEAQPLLETLIGLGRVAGFSVDLFIERRTKSESMKDRRTDEQIESPADAATRGARKLFWTLSMGSKKDPQSTPLQALIWTLAMVAIENTA